MAEVIGEVGNNSELFLLNVMASEARTLTAGGVKMLPKAVS